MAQVSHKLNNSFEGALAGGGDPATSPLYVFGPFIKLIVVAGVAQITFGTSVWLVVLTIAVVSAMYRLVMQWVTDGSGGSGLSEEEFGGWAVKVNATITFIEYTLTFLVSMSAMVTFIVDRIPLLNERFLWIQYRTIVAIILSILTGWLVNRGPKVAARAFGPATAGVLLLLWAMVIATIWKLGFHLPSFDLRAFSPQNIRFTVGGYARILAVMTGIEVFANLVAAYDGSPNVKSRQAFNSLLIIMGTTAVTMLVVGPAIFQLSDPTNEHVSVFTQTMDQLLPSPLPILGTLVSVAVLMSASAASALGLQNLALGLKQRRYIPPSIGQRNQFEVADKPVWIEVGIVSLCFLLFGTDEETYLAIYAAGVFILLSMTGWAVTKRLAREVKVAFSPFKAGLIVGTVSAALLTTGAAGIIFIERFLEGAWTYFLFVPLLYAMFTHFRNRLGEPTPELDYLGQFDAYQLAGFGFGQAGTTEVLSINGDPAFTEITWQPDPIEKSKWREEQVELVHIVVLLDGSSFAAQAIPMAKKICEATNSHLTLFSSIKNDTQSQQNEFDETCEAREAYLSSVAAELRAAGLQINYKVLPGHIADTTEDLVASQGIDLVITSSRGKPGVQHWLNGGVSRKLVQKLDIPVLMVQNGENTTGAVPAVTRILVALDGSIFSERALPYARKFARAFNSELVLISVPAVPDVQNYRAPPDFIEDLRGGAEVNMRVFLEAVARSLRDDGISVSTVVTGSMPARTIMTVGEEKGADLIMMTSQGRGGLDILLMGSVAQRVIQQAEYSVFIVPIQEEMS